MNENCRLCKNNNIETIFDIDLNYEVLKKLSNINISSCDNCGFCFNKNLSQYDCNDYYANTNTYVHDLYHTKELQENRFKHLNRLFDKYNIKYDDEIIDLTSSDGTLLDYLSYLGYNNLTYCDISQKNIDKNTKYKNCFKLNILDTNDYQQFNKKYKVIFLNHTLEHIIDFNKLFYNIDLIMDNNSFLYIEVPDINRISLNKNPFLEITFEHVNFFNINLLNNLCQNYNLFCLENSSLDFDYKIYLNIKACYGLYIKKNNISILTFKDQTIIKQNIKKYINECIYFADKIYGQIDKTKSYSIYGIGLFALYFLSLYQDLSINNIYDDTKFGKIKYGKKYIYIKNTDEYIKDENVLILTPNYYNMICDKIISKNIKMNILPINYIL